MDADDDMLAVVARELVEKGGVGDSADVVWEELRNERTAHLPPAPAAEQFRQRKWSPKFLTCWQEF